MYTLKNKSNTMEKATFVYVYDALCGWCYGFSPVVKALKARYQDELNFEVVSGGMILGDREGPIGEVAPYIKKAYQQVEERSGIQFGEAFVQDVLEEGTMYFSSWWPSVALTAMKQLAPEHAVDFAHDIQRAIYYEGLEIHVPTNYTQYATAYGVDVASFEAALEDEMVQAATRADFDYAQALQVSGFPTCFLKKDDQYYRIGHGFMPLAHIAANLEEALSIAAEQA